MRRQVHRGRGDSGRSTPRYSEEMTSADFPQDRSILSSGPCSSCSEPPPCPLLSLLALRPPCPQPGTVGRTVGPRPLSRSCLGGDARLSHPLQRGRSDRPHFRSAQAQGWVTAPGYPARGQRAGRAFCLVRQRTAPASSSALPSRSIFLGRHLGSIFLGQGQLGLGESGGSPRHHSAPCELGWELGTPASQ